MVKLKDFNFFQPYLDSGEKSKETKLSKMIVASILIVGLTVFPLLNAWKIYKGNNEVTAVSNVFNSPALQEGKRNFDTLMVELDSLKENTTNFQGLISYFHQESMINDYLLYTINEQIPENVFLQTLKITKKEIQLQGIAKNKTAIALFENNLRRIDGFKDIFIPNIIEDSNHYTFTLSLSIKDGDEK